MADFGLENIVVRGSSGLPEDSLLKRFPRITPDPNRPLTSAPIIDDDARSKILTLEQEARNRIVAKTNDTSHYSSFKIDYNLLDKSDRERILGEIDDLIGITGEGNVLERYGVSLYKDFEQASSTRSKAFGRIPANLASKIAAGELTANDLMIASMSFTHDMTELQGVGGTVEPYASHYRPGSTRFSFEYLEKQAQALNEFKGLEDYVVFDIETPGLSPREGIFEYATRRYSRGREAENVLFYQPENVAMRTGAVAYGDEMLTPAEFMSRVLGEAGVSPMDEFTGVKKTLQQMEKTGWTVLGHNIEFDMSRLLDVAQKMPQYNTDSEFQRLVMNLTDAMQNNQSKFIDTYLWSQMVLHDIDIARELTDKSTFTKHSLENIMAQTDMLEWGVKNNFFADVTQDGFQALTDEEKVARNLSALEELLSSRTHTGTVDTSLERVLAEYLSSIHLGTHAPVYRRGEIAAGGLISDAIRSKVFGSPIAPRIPISDPSLISPIIRSHPELGPLFGTMEAPGVRYLNPEQQSAILSRLAFAGQEAQIPSVQNPVEAAKRFRYLRARIFNEQGAFMTGPRLGPPSNIAQLEQYQRELIGADVPYSRLHYTEREATAALQEVSDLNYNLFNQLEDATVDSRFAAGIDDLIARQYAARLLGDFAPDTFVQLSEANVFRSGVASLPIEFVEEALGRELTHLSLSVLPEQYKEIALNVDLMSEPEDLKRVMAALASPETYERFGIRSEEATAIRTAISKGRAAGKVQVASIGGGKKDDSVAKIARIITSLGGSQVDESAGNRSPLVMMLGRKSQGFRETVSGKLRGQSATRRFMSGGPIVFDTSIASPSMLEDEINYVEQQRGLIGSIFDQIFGAGRPEGTTQRTLEQIPSMREVRNTLTQVERTTASQAEASGIIDAISAATRGSVTEQAAARNAVIKKFGKITAVGAAVSLAGYFVYKKVKENSKLDQTMARQDYEDSYQNSFRPEAPEYELGNPVVPVDVPIAQNRASRRLEYMQAAGTTRRMWNRRIGHTNMSNDRYNHLYGG